MGRRKREELYQGVIRFGDTMFKLFLVAILMIVVILLSPWIFGITLAESLQIARMVIIWLIFSTAFTYVILKGVKKRAYLLIL